MRRGCGGLILKIGRVVRRGSRCGIDELGLLVALSLLLCSKAFLRRIAGDWQ